MDAMTAHYRVRRTAIKAGRYSAVCAKLILFLLASTFLAGCNTTGEGVGLLPPPPAGEIPASSYQAQNPYVQLAQGLFTRTMYAAASGTGYRVEVRDLLVGPGQRTEEVSLPGAAVLEFRSGNGAITAGGKRQEFAARSTFVLSEGQAFVIENSAEIRATIRAYVYTAQGARE